MMPILQASGVMTPGQFGPIRIDFVPWSARLTFIMSSDRDAFGDADDELELGVDRLRMASAAKGGGT